MITTLHNRLVSESGKKQLQAVQQLGEVGEAGLAILMDFLHKRLTQADTRVTEIDGKIYQVLLKANTEATCKFLAQHFPGGVVPLKSARDIDYSPLQIALARCEFQVADQVTLQKMCELSGETALQRKWLYFTEVESFPVTDLQTIDTLWLTYSEGKFGFSVQRRLWLSVDKDWDRLWFKIGWKTGNSWTRYPNEFIWDLSAPQGHLPLSNQLRGVRVIASLLSHPAWTN
jgi:hypothetical protein